VKTNTSVPLSSCAFDDAATRRTYERMRRRALVSLLCRVGIWFALLVVAKVVETDSQLVEGAASFLLIPSALLLIGPGRRLRWMISVGRVLKSCPWQRCDVTCPDGVRSDSGTPVRVRFFGGNDEVLSESVMTARTWRVRRPRAGLLSDGVWFAGDPTRGGVIARAGGYVLMSVQHAPQPKFN
jgi:hypothetical protein